MSKRCDKFFCFRRATLATQDLKETQPVNGWRNWEGLGLRYGCYKHPPLSSREYMLNGTIEYSKVKYLPVERFV